MKELKTDVEIRIGEEPTSEANDFGGISFRMPLVQTTMNQVIAELKRMAIARNDGEDTSVVGALAAIMSQPDLGEAPVSEELTALNDLFSLSGDEFRDALKAQFLAVLEQLAKAPPTN